MTHFCCVGVENNEAQSLSGLTAGAQGHNRSSDVTRRTEQTLGQQLTDVHCRLEDCKVALQSSMATRPHSPTAVSEVQHDMHPHNVN